ncbi:MAG: rhomboid family intramembrane serine protease [Deltaproteobacteria bacterium]|nr:rhomboid family intramembrane serine protease [Candidatus Zymogenaceae bacterium]
MIPLRDNVPAEKTPFVTYVLIAINIAAFFYELALGKGLDTFVFYYGVVPETVTSGLYGPQYTILPFFTSMFLHGGWLHIIGNMLFLWIFGDNVEDRMGHFLYLIFYLASGLGASLLHVVSDPHSAVPTIGASGAIAGVMGAYFVLYPKARVTSVVILIYFIRLMEIPAVVFLGIWFLIQIFSGVASIGADAASGGVAFWAHVGGFIVGLAGGGLARLLTKDPTKGRVEVITRDGKRYLH